MRKEGEKFVLTVQAGTFKGRQQNRSLIGGLVTGCGDILMLGGPGNRL